MKFRTTLIAAILLALFGAYVYFFEFKKAEEEKKQAEEAKELYSIDWEKLKGLKVTNAHGTFRFEKLTEEAEEGDAASGKADAWRIVDPLETEAEDSAINGLVRNLKGAKVEQVVTESAENLENFGLKEPEIKVDLLVDEGEQAPATILLGGKSPVGSNSYAMFEGKEKVLLLNTHLNAQFDKDLYDFRNKKLFDFKAKDVERLRILRRDEPELEIARQDDRWEIVQPIRARAAQSEVESALNKLIGLKAESFNAEEPEDLAVYGLDEPVGQFEMVLKPDQTKATLLVGSIHQRKGKGYLFVKRGERPVVASVGMDLIGTFSKDAEEFREKKVIPFKTWKIKKVDLAWKGQEATLEQKEGNKWWITAPIEARADGTRMSAFLGTLSRLEADEFLEKPESREDLDRYGLADPLARIALYEEKPSADEEDGGAEKTEYQPLGVVLIGKSGDEQTQYYATEEGGKTVYRVKESFYEQDFPETIDTLRSRKLLDLSRFLVFGIDYQGPEGPIVLRRSEMDWKVEKPDSRKVERKDVDELISEIIDLEVDRFIEQGSEDLASLGLDPAMNRVVLTQEDGDEMGALLFSDKGPEGEEGLVYAKAKGEPWVGLLPDTKKRALLDLLARFRSQG